MRSVVDLSYWLDVFCLFQMFSKKVYLMKIDSTFASFLYRNQTDIEKLSVLNRPIITEHYLPGGMPLANVIGKGGIANNDAAAIVPPAIATGAAASAKISINPSKRQSLV